MTGITTAFWSVTINNYDDKDLAIIRNGYPDYCREIVHTLERGENGTPHIQAWVKLQRQQRLSFVTKLFPGCHARPLTSDEYNENTKNYAQKLDATAESCAVHKFNDPMNTIESVVRKMAIKIVEYQINLEDKGGCYDSIEHIRRETERDMVALEDYKLAKIFISPVYRKMWNEFGMEILTFFTNKVREEKHKDTHTHTHKDKKLSRQDTTTDGESSEERSFSEEEGSEGDGEGEGYGECESSDGSDEASDEGNHFSFGR